ncbi:MAG: hypothetical protein V4461_08755 [Pseudomonadota bacterium]
MKRASIEIWQSIVRECARREQGWATALDNATDAERRWKLVEQMNADMSRWHQIAVVVAARGDVSPSDLAAILRTSRPSEPTDAGGWLTLVNAARRTLDQAIQRKDDDTVRGMAPLWRWLYLIVHIWTLPNFDRTAAQMERAVA